MGGGGSGGMMDGNAATNFLLQALMSNGGNNAALISQLLSSGGPAASLLLQNLMQQPFTQQNFPMNPKNVSPYWFNQNMNNKVILMCITIRVISTIKRQKGLSGNSFTTFQKSNNKISHVFLMLVLALQFLSKLYE